MDWVRLGLVGLGCIGLCCICGVRLGLGWILFYAMYSTPTVQVAVVPQAARQGGFQKPWG